MLFKQRYSGSLAFLQYCVEILTNIYIHFGRFLTNFYSIEISIFDRPLKNVDQTILEAQSNNKLHPIIVVRNVNINYSMLCKYKKRLKKKRTQFNVLSLGGTGRTYIKILHSGKNDPHLVKLT